VQGALFVGITLDLFSSRGLDQECHRQQGECQESGPCAPYSHQFLKLFHGLPKVANRKKTFLTKRLDFISIVGKNQGGE
jgi:hypothetical protein